MNKISDIASLEKDFLDNVFDLTTNISSKWPNIKQVGAGKTVCFYPILVNTEMKRWPERFMRQRKWVSLTKLKKKQKYRHLRQLLSALEKAKPNQKKKIFKRLRQNIA